MNTVTAQGAPATRERDELWAILRCAGLQPPGTHMEEEFVASYSALKAAIGQVHAALVAPNVAKEQP